MREISLNKDWRLHEAPMDWGRDMLPRVMRFDGDWMDCDLPCDIHMPLQQTGRIGDVVKADYCFGAEWTEHRSWWFVKEFDGGEIDPNSDVIELTLESLDAHAHVFLNGEWLGEHNSAHFPFVKGIKQIVQPGRNTLAVCMTTGLEQVNDQMLSELGLQAGANRSDLPLNRLDWRRSFVRKPQYTVGWDWGPKALTCGIVKDVYIKTYRKTAIRGVHVATTEIKPSGDALLKLSLEIEQLDVVKTRNADVEIRVLYDGELCAEHRLEDVLLTSGTNYLDETLVLRDAKLWWPSGYGDQPLYTVEVSVVCEKEREEYPPFDFGVRTLSLDTSRMDKAEDTRWFTLIVNGVRIYCKGGDWIPSDSIYARVGEEKFETLLSEAKEANFNMLRIWGGGCYEYDVFYNLCDQKGLLLWHDFMFACSLYPEHLEWFKDLADKEIDYQTRRLRNHACLALWSGSNENHYIFGAHPDLCYEKQLGLKIANNDAKRHVRANCPNIPYWNSSPYGGEIANAENIGNVHHWGLGMMNPEMIRRIEPKVYDEVQARFVTEYGYPGPCCKDTIEEYFDGKPIDRKSPVWALHNNEFEKETVNAGIEKHYLDDAQSLSLDDYILYAGMVQSTMLSYSLEAMRFKDFCSGSLFWMYNDTWGEVGWTIIDYHLRRKISFYGVKRAFAPVKLSLREENGRVKLQGINDTPEDVSVKAKVGFLSFDGEDSRLQDFAFTLRAHTREYLLVADLPDGDYTKGTFVVLPDDEKIEPVALRTRDVRALSFGGARIEVLCADRQNEDLIIKLTSKTYAHGVHTKRNDAMSDNYFDLLPGQVKTVVIHRAGDGLPDWHIVK